MHSRPRELCSLGRFHCYCPVTPSRRLASGCITFRSSRNSVSRIRSHRAVPVPRRPEFFWSPDRLILEFARTETAAREAGTDCYQSSNRCANGVRSFLAGGADICHRQGTAPQLTLRTSVTFKYNVMLTDPRKGLKLRAGEGKRVLITYETKPRKTYVVCTKSSSPSHMQIHLVFLTVL